MNSSNLFPYILDNLNIYSPDIVGIIIGVIFCLVLMISAYYALLYGKVAVLLWEEKKKIEKKKHVLWDLILMKDIQTELENEIEKAMLKSTFQ